MLRKEGIEIPLPLLKRYAAEDAFNRVLAIGLLICGLFLSSIGIVYLYKLLEPTFIEILITLVATAIVIFFIWLGEYTISLREWRSLK